MPDRETIDPPSYMDLVLAILWVRPKGIRGRWPLHHLALKCVEALGLGWELHWRKYFFGMYNPEVEAALNDLYGIGFVRAIHEIQGVTYQLNHAGRKVVREGLAKIIALDTVRDVVRREWRIAKEMGKPKKAG